MAHVAKLNENNVVTEVIVVSNDYEPNVEEFAAELLGGVWKQTSYNGTIRNNFAGIGYTYDPIDDAFIPPIPECGHEELFLNNLKRWECSNDEHQTEII
jgi:hypothetical protein